jgi:hypothetical protein
MAYIGRDTDKISNVEVLDNITFDGSSSYTLQKNSVNFTPSSANTLLVSIDGVVQAGNFTVSGSTIDFGTAVAGTSTCDFILHYGVGLITTPADGTVTEAKIGSGAVTSAKITYPLTTFSSTGIDDNATSTAITIDSSENVGIGTSSPSANLEVRGASSNGQIYLGGSTTATYGKFYSDNDGTLIASADAGNNAASSYFGVEVDGTERMRINTNGNIQIGTTTESARLHIASSTTAGTDPLVVFSDGSGTDCGSIDLNATANTVAYTTSSDYRLKENVDYNFDATSRLKQLKPARFNFIADANTTVDGFLAHEVQSVIPEAITGIKDQTVTKEKVVVNADGNVIAENIEQADWEAGKIPNEEGTSQYPVDSTWEASKVVPVYQGIDQSKLVPLLVKTIQELEARITTLENA